MRKKYLIANGEYKNYLSVYGEYEDFRQDVISEYAQKM
jgi:hypothetical protein